MRLVPTFDADTYRLGEELYDLCKSKENKFAEVDAFLHSLIEEQIGKIVRYKDKVNES